jgi:hypothetical protein
MPFEQTDKNGFEVETCSRCGGCGRYSWNQVTGDRCFKCAGAGVTYTKRAKVAREWFREQQMTTLADLAVGDLVYSEPGIFAGGWTRVVSIEEARPYSYEGEVREALTVQYQRFGGMTAPKSFRVRRSGPDHADLLAQAVAMQETLNRLGKPSKASKGGA